MDKRKSLPRDVRLPLILAVITLAAMLVEFRWGFWTAMFAGLYGWVIGLVSFPMKRYRRMFACFGLIAFCILVVWLSAFFYFPDS